MAENRNMYGGHDVSGYVPPTSNALPSENPDQAPDLNMEYLEKEIGRASCRERVYVLV